MKTHLANCRKSENKKCFTCLLSELSKFNGKTTEEEMKQKMQFQILGNYFAKLMYENFLSTNLILKIRDVNKFFYIAMSKI